MIHFSLSSAEQSLSRADTPFDCTVWQRSTYTVSDSLPATTKIFQFRTQIYDHLQDYSRTRVFVFVIHSRFSSLRVVFSLRDFVIAIRSKFWWLRVSVNIAIKLINLEKFPGVTVSGASHVISETEDGHNHLELAGESGS